MGKISTLIGRIVKNTPELNRTIDGEKFYTIQVSFRDTVMPVLYSEFTTNVKFDVGDKVKISGCLMSDISEGNLPVFYFYANAFEVVDLDTETTNVINFSCVVTKVRDFKTNSRCVDILPLVASDGSPLNTTSVLYLCARGSIARKLKDKKKGYTVTGTGYIKAFRDVYEVYIMDLENLDELTQ